MLVRDVMNQDSVVCTEDMPLSKVFELLQENGGNFIPVVESPAHLMPIGVITEHDICLNVIGQRRNPQDLTAGHVMNPNIVKTLSTSTLFDCSELMKKNQIKQVMVVDENGFLCGTITHFDIESTKTRQHFEDLFSRALEKTFSNPSLNRIY